MLRPQLLPDEHADSYLGAIVRLNGFSGRNDVERAERGVALIEGWSFSSSAHASPTPLDRFAAVAGVAPGHLLQHHTLVPVIANRMIAPPSQASTSLRIALGSETVKEEACFCPDCVASDLSTYGRSYWRREHQLPGIYWCSKHRRGLRAVKRKHAFLHAPSLLLDEAEEFDYDWVRTLWSHKFIARYLDVLQAFMDATEPITPTSVRDALRTIAKPMGYQISPNGGAFSSATVGVLSRDIHQLFPDDWLKKTFPAYRQSSASGIQYWLDAALWMKIPPSSVAAYSLAASILFESGDAFMRAVRQNQVGVGAHALQRARVAETTQDSDQAIKEAKGAPEPTTPPEQSKSGRRSRRLRSPQAKAAIVQRTYEPGVSVADVASKEGIDRRTLYTWRNLERKGALGNPFEDAVDVSPELAAARAEISRLQRLLDRVMAENNSLKTAARLRRARHLAV